MAATPLVPKLRAPYNCPFYRLGWKRWARRLSAWRHMQWQAKPGAAAPFF